MTRFSPNTLGAIYMMLSMAFFVFNDAIIKSLAGQLEFYQIFAFRGPIAIVMTFGVALAIDGRRSVGDIAGWCRHPGVLIRVAAEVIGGMLFLQALFHLPLSDATAILQTLPLMLTVSGALFFGEAVGWRRYLAAFAGFLGVLLIIRPGFEQINIYSWYALAAAFSFAMRDLFTKSLPRGIPSIWVTLLTVVAVTVLGGIMTAMQPLPHIDTSIAIRLFAAAFFVSIGLVFATLTVRTGEISFIAPFRYSILIWAIIMGIVVFSEFPPLLSLIGAAIVAGSGLYTFYRERLSLRNSATRPASASISR